MSGKKLTLDFAKAAKGVAPVGGAPDERDIQELSDDELDKVSGGVDVDWDKYTRWDKFNCDCGSPLINHGGSPMSQLECPNCGTIHWVDVMAGF